MGGAGNKWSKRHCSFYDNRISGLPYLDSVINVAGIRSCWRRTKLQFCVPCGKNVLKHKQKHLNICWHAYRCLCMPYRSANHPMSFITSLLWTFSKDTPVIVFMVQHTAHCLESFDCVFRLQRASNLVVPSLLFSLGCEQCIFSPAQIGFLISYHYCFFISRLLSSNHY